MVRQIPNGQTRVPERSGEKAIVSVICERVLFDDLRNVAIG